MGTAIIFSLVTILAFFGFFSALRNRNVLGAIFGIGATAVFGFFSVMTFVSSGFPS